MLTQALVAEYKTVIHLYGTSRQPLIIEAVIKVRADSSVQRSTLQPGIDNG